MDISFKLGETWRVDVDCNDADGNPISLVGGTVSFRISDRDGDVITIDRDSGVEVTNEALGKCTIEIEPNQQTDFKPYGRYTYEVRIMTAAGFVSTQAEGAWGVEPSLFD